MNNPFPFNQKDFSHVALETGTEVFHQGQAAQSFLLVESGEVKVHTWSADGRDVVLYRVRPGELCVLTTISLIGDHPYRADAVVTSPTRAGVLAAPRFHELLDESPVFRRFVFNQLSARLADVLARLESLMLDRVPRRLAQCLLREVDEQGTVRATHERLARDIGTAREVVSRHLGQLEKQGLVTTRRGRIDILDPEQLRSWAGGTF
jgi:CRP/FNR family transcriptional regulator